MARLFISRAIFCPVWLVPAGVWGDAKGCDVELSFATQASRPDNARHDPTEAVRGRWSSPPRSRLHVSWNGRRLLLARVARQASSRAAVATRRRPASRPRYAPRPPPASDARCRSGRAHCPVRTNRAGVCMPGAPISAGCWPAHIRSVVRHGDRGEVCRERARDEIIGCVYCKQPSALRCLLLDDQGQARSVPVGSGATAELQRLSGRSPADRPSISRTSECRATAS